jgi:hypothetical protein
MKPKKYKVEEAAKILSKVVREAESGKDVYITDGKLLVKAVPIAAGLKQRVPGGFEGKIWWTSDCFDPLTDEEMKELGFE